MVVMTGVVDQWPAYEKWKNLEYLNELAGYCFRTVPIELGRNYLESGWTQRLMTLESFFDDIIRSLLLLSKGDVIGYLAQHDLFEQIKELRDDFLVPDYTALTGDEEDDTLVMNAWLGPGGTVTPLHYDNYNNIFAQVVGSKYIRLYHPREQEAMYPHGGTEYNTSRVDVEEVDKEKFPLFQKASFTDCVLEAGQCLFIPKGYWHYVRSCETSFSISFWWK
uniref:JmjC domain-containing protein n=1 Tax=Guillardia theta (strain CCMP2712) TaxID=905079 RepID=A0A0C3UA91_GUITC